MMSNEEEGESHQERQGNAGKSDSQCGCADANQFLGPRLKTYSKKKEDRAEFAD